MGGGISRNPYQSGQSGTASRPITGRFANLREGTGFIQHPDPTHWMEERQHRPLGGFSGSSSSDGLTEEQEREIAENIYDWWISGKSYKKWYAERFLQYKIEFED